MVASRAHLLTILDEVIAEGVVPGLAVVAGQAGHLSLREVRGWRQRAAGGGDAASDVPGADTSALYHPKWVTRPVTETTLWDLASLTKALVTSVLAMQAVESGAVSLDQPLGAAPGGADAATTSAITVRRALSHAAGFAAHLPFWPILEGLAGRSPSDPGARAAIVAAAGAAPLAYHPGEKSVYSDVGFILLGDLLERALGDRLDRLAARLGPPFGAPAFAFRPVGETIVAGDNDDIAATTLCPTRGYVAKGEVDDRNAWAMGGVAGHAGLFGTMDALAVWVHRLLGAYRGAGVAGAPPVVDREVLRLFWTPAGVPGSTWRLGWEGPSAQGSLAGDRIARTAVGHLAFTGCSLWIDPEREAWVALLSNRHHPTVSTDPRFRDLRRTVNDVALDVMGY